MPSADGCTRGRAWAEWGREEQQHGIGGARHGWPPPVASGPSITQSSIAGVGQLRAWVRAWQRKVAAPVVCGGTTGRGRPCEKKRAGRRATVDSGCSRTRMGPGPFSRVETPNPCHSCPVVGRGAARQALKGTETQRQLPPARIRPAPPLPINRMRVCFHLLPVECSAPQRCRNPEIASPSHSRGWHSQSTEAQRERNQKNAPQPGNPSPSPRCLA